MRLRRSALPSLLLGLIAAAPVSAQRSVAITGATLIDGRGGAPVPDAVLVITDGRIAAAGPRSAVRIPAGAATMPAPGKYLIPGLMDANVHLVYGVSIEFLARYEGRFEALIEEAAQVGLRNGLTTMFDSWGPLAPLLAVRDRIRRGEVPGSRLFVAGNIIGLTGPFGRDFNGPAETSASKGFVKRINTMWEEGTGPELMWMTPDSVRVAIRQYAGKGMDFLKYAVSGHTQMEMLMFSPEQQRAIVEEGHRAGLVVQTHTTSVESLRQAVEAGVDLMQHCSITGRVPVPDATIELVKTHHVYCAIQPITRKRQDIMKAVGPSYGPRVYFADLVGVEAENEARMIKAGLPLLLATDAGIMDPDERDSRPANMSEDESTALGEAHFLWFQAVKEMGMPPMDALLAATRNIAEAYHVANDLGTLEPGKRADLLILDANPLDDIMNVRKIATVMKDGMVVDRAALPVRKVLTAR